MTRRLRLVSPSGTGEESRTKTNKHSIFGEICDHLNIPVEEAWLSEGSTVTAEGLQAILIGVAKETGTAPKHLSGHEKLVWRLVHKSTEAMILALEVINKPSISYRLECSLLLLLNAWESLLKARIVQLESDAEAINEEAKPKRTIPFLKALRIIFASEKDVIRMNLERLYDLRNDAAHLFISVVPAEPVLMFQAAVFNYEKQLNGWFQRSLCDGIPLGMMFLVPNIDAAIHSVDSPVLTRNLSPESLAYLKQWQENFKNDLDSIAENEIGSYVVPLDIRLSVVNNPKKADVLAYLDSLAKGESSVAVRFQRPIDTHPLSFREGLVPRVKRSMPDVNERHINYVISRFKVKENPELSLYNFRFKKHEETWRRTGEVANGTPSIYGHKAVQFILEKLRDDEIRAELGF